MCIRDSPTDNRRHRRAVGRRDERRASAQAVEACEGAEDGGDGGDFHRLVVVQLRKQARQSLGEHRLARARRTHEVKVVRTRGGDLDGEAPFGLADDCLLYTSRCV